MNKIVLLLLLLALHIPAFNQVLLTENFEGDDFPPAGWTLVNENDPKGYHWTYNSDPSLLYVSFFGEPYPSHGGSGSMVYEFDSEAPAKAWAITPGVTMEAGKVYLVSFYYLVADENYPEKLKVTVGRSANVQAQSQILWNNNGQLNLINAEEWENGVMEFTPTQNGTYYFGFNCYSDADQSALLIDDIRIEEKPSQVPPCTQLLSPVNNTTEVEARPVTLTWQSIPEASGYDLYLDVDNPPINVYSNLSDTTVSFNAEFNTTYYWYVVPKNSAGSALGCNTSINKFTTSAPPPSPQCANIIGPKDGETNVDPNNILFSWNSVQFASQYSFFFGETIDLDSLGATTDTLVGLTSTLQYSTTYYWKLVPENDGGSAAACDTFSFTTMDAPPLPENDTACNAITLEINGTSDCKNTISATSENSDIIECSVPNNTVWYKFTPSVDDRISIVMKKREGATVDLNSWIGLYTSSGECPNLTFTQIDNCASADLQFEDSVEIVTGQLQAGITYYIMIDGNAGATGEFCIRLKDAPPPPENDDCSNATVITSAIPLEGTTLAATESMPAEECGTFGNGDPNIGDANDDVWYTFTANQSGIGIITVTPNGSFDPVVMAYTGNCSQLINIGCSDVGGDGGEEILTLSNLEAGKIYYYRVYGWYAQGNEGTFTTRVSGAALPLRAIVLNGQNNNKINMLKWEAEDEHNDKGFELQRSADGAAFGTISFISSKNSGGNSKSEYTANDEKPFQGNTYYRVRKVYNDGRYILSNVLLLKTSISSDFQISNAYPNPFNQKLNVVISSPSPDKAEIMVSDAAGKMVLRQPTQLLRGNNLLTIDLSKLSKGNYFVKVICSKGCFLAMQKVVKQ